MAEWIQNGGQLAPAEYAASVTDVVVAYIEFATDYYAKGGKPTDELRLIKVAAKIMRQLYGRSPATAFGPLALKAFRDVMIGNNWCRTRISRQVDRIKRMFK